MATHNGCSSIPVESGSAITLGRFIVLAADGQVDHVAGAQGDVDGIAGEDAAASGKCIPMIVPDGKVAKVVAGATLAIGDLVASDATGKAIVWVDAAANKCMGRVRKGGASGELVEIQFYAKKVGAGS